jgi:hypothetical protein
MGGTLITLYLFTLIINLLKRIFPVPPPPPANPPPAAPQEAPASAPAVPPTVAT